MLKVGLNRRSAEEESCLDLVPCQPLRRQSQHFELTRGQRLRPQDSSPTPEKRAQLVTAYAKNKDSGQLEPVPPRADFGAPDRPPQGNGGLYSTGPDYARFCQMLLNNGEVSGRRYLSRAAMKFINTPQTGDLPTIIHIVCLKQEPIGASGNEVLRSVITPFCQRTPRQFSSVSHENPTAWPLLLMLKAKLKKSPGSVPRSIIAPLCQRKA